MINISNIEVFNFRGALRGMRNPMNSWVKSDSFQCDDCNPDFCGIYKSKRNCHCFYTGDYFVKNNYAIGNDDLDLAQRLISAGPVHSKFMRQIFVSMDIEAPLSWWKEMDTYKINTVADSCSTMHKIHSEEFTRDNFTHEHLNENSLKVLDTVIEELNKNREKFLKTEDKTYWWQMIELLPSTYNQKRTWTANYEVLRNIYAWRRNHKLDDWRTFCHMIEQLPYGKELICYKIED